VTRRDLLDPARAASDRIAELVRRAPVFVYDDATLRHIADRMVEERIGRVPVVGRTLPLRPIGMISRSDLLHAHQRRLHGATRAEKTFSFPRREAPAD
jgi:CBS domain-containing protein